MRLKLLAPYLIYLLINCLFVFKYTSRPSNINEYIVTEAYFIAMLLFIYFYSKMSFMEYFYKYLFWIVALVFFVFTIYLNLKVDGTTLNVDRWSAMDVAVNALLNREYPYSAVDHMQGRTSNLPSLIFIGIPFFLMGDVGYLQSVTFILFLYVIYDIFKSYRDRLFCILLLVLSPSYIWEIYVKSDLMSNFILVLLFLIIIQKKISKGGKLNTILISFLSSIPTH